MKSVCSNSFFLLVVVIMASAVSARAEALLKNFSLGYDTLTLTAPSDFKVPVTSAMTARYTFFGEKRLTPYLGTGLAYTLYPEPKPGDNLKITAGVAGKAGLSVNLEKNATFDLDYSYLRLPPEAVRGDSKARPQSIGFGLKIRF